MDLGQVNSRAPFQFDEDCAVEPFHLDDSGGAVLPPPGLGTGGGRGRGTPRTPVDRQAISPWMTLIVSLLVVASGTLQLTILALGARGGQAAVYAVTIAAAALFLGPFFAGAVWFDHMRKAE